MSLCLFLSKWKACSNKSPPPSHSEGWPTAAQHLLATVSLCLSGDRRWGQRLGGAGAKLPGRMLRAVSQPPPLTPTAAFSSTRPNRPENECAPGSTVWQWTRGISEQLSPLRRELCQQRNKGTSSKVQRSDNGPLSALHQVQQQACPTPSF